MLQRPEANERFGDFHECLMNIRSTIESNSEPSKVMQPSECSLGDPAINSQTASMCFIATSQMWFNAALTKLIAMRLRVITPIGIKSPRSIDRMTRLSGDGRNAIHQRDQLSDIMAIRTGQGVAQRNSIRVRQNVVLAARFPAICRIWPGFSASADGSDRGAVYSSIVKVNQISSTKLVQHRVM